MLLNLEGNENQYKPSIENADFGLTIPCRLTQHFFFDLSQGKIFHEQRIYLISFIIFYESK